MKIVAVSAALVLSVLYALTPGEAGLFAGALYFMAKVTS